MADSTEHILGRVAKFLEQEREFYGDFSVGSDAINASATDKEKEPEPNGVSDQTDNNVVRENETEYRKQSPSSPPESATDNRDITTHLQSCDTLDELRALCKKAEELRTELENTNLVFGVGNPNADLMIVGEAPGFNEDKQGEPFVGKAGKLLNKILDAINFSRSDVYIANILKHRPPNNRNPLPEERSRSLPFLIRQIELVDPKIILCLGKVSANTLLNNSTALGKLRGKFHPFMQNIELMATYHPAALLRNQKWKRPTWEDVQLLRERYDELEGTPR